MRRGTGRDTLGSESTCAAGNAAPLLEKPLPSILLLRASPCTEATSTGGTWQGGAGEAAAGVAAAGVAAAGAAFAGVASDGPLLWCKGGKGQIGL